MRMLAAVLVVSGAMLTMGQAEVPSPSVAEARPAAYGKPIQAEIQPGQTVSYPSTNREIQAYRVTPKGVPASSPPTGEGEGSKVKMPAILYIHDIFGLNDFARHQVEALARQGYSVLAPNLYSRLENSDKGFDARAAWVAYEKTPDSQVMQDLLAAINYLNKDGASTAEQPLAVVGHDMGGIYAMKLASHDLRVTAAVNYYGRIVYSNTTPDRPISPIEDLFNLKAPLLSFYGGNDPQAPGDQLRALESRLSHNPHKTYYEVVRIPGVGHGFLVPGRQGYNAEAAGKSEEQVRDFLARYLRAEPKKLEE